MSSKEHKIFILYSIFVLFFIFLTTKYLNLYEIIHVAGQMDAISYTEISNSAPDLPKNNDIIIKHVAQRFLIPYLAGSISNFLNIDSFLIFKFFTQVFIFVFWCLVFFYVKNQKFNIRESVIFFSLLFLNPYIIRNHVFNPVQAHDLLFFSITLILSYLIINNKNRWLIFFGSVGIFLRQTAVALFIGSFLILLKKKRFIECFFLSILFLFFLFFISLIADIISPHNFSFKYAYGIIFYDFSQIEKLIRFLGLPIISFFPLGIFILSKIKKNIDKDKFLILTFICLMMIAQPILAGPDGSLRNIVRISTLCYPIIVSLLFYRYDISKIINNNLIFFTYVAGLFIWSLHPTFSIFDFFGFLRF